LYLIGLAIYFWFVIFILPIFLSFEQIIEWTMMQMMIMPLFIFGFIVVSRYWIAAILRWLWRRIKGLFGFIRKMLGKVKSRLRRG